MTEETLASIWNKVCEKLLIKHDDVMMRAALKKSQCSAINSADAVILVSNQRVVDILMKYCYSDICLWLSEFSGEKIESLKFTVHKFDEDKPNTTPIHRAVHPSQATETSLFKVNTDHSLEPNPLIQANLNPKYTFISFISGKNSRMAYAAAMSVAERPGSSGYNPLYLYGGVGLGKTHLMQAIGNEAIARDPKTRVLYISGDSFTDEFVSYIRGGKGKDAFKQKYRNIDIFLVDDIQFIAGKDGTQQEFFHIFNTLHQLNRQIVMTSDRVPNDIKGLEDRLSSRFNMGMVVDLQLPDRETREAILLTKAQERGINLNKEIIRYLADVVDTNIRELEGALHRVALEIRANNLQPTLANVKSIVHTMNPSAGHRKKSDSQRLVEIICELYNITAEDLLGPRRQKELVHPRQILMYLYKYELGMTFPGIAKEVGGRDHTTAMHSVSKIEKEIKRSPELLEDLQHIKEHFYH